ncbi:MAG: AmmeMemoRadiSam system protein A [Dethiobacteria bacterium]
MLKIIGLAPHPPLIIPEVGRGELAKVKQTVEGMKQLSRRIRKSGPERLIVITPHGPMLREGIAVMAEPLLEGDFGQFGAPNVKVSLETDLVLLDHLQRETEGESLRPVFLSSGDRRLRRMPPLDHGAGVPLYYLQQAGVSVPGLHLTYTFAPFRELYRFGQALRRAVEARGLPVAVVASGDLSHRLIPGAPAGYSPQGKEYDRLLVELLREGRVEDILNLDEELVEEAGECALRSFLIALGMFAGETFQTEILSYEGPFGVGYLVAELCLSKAEQGDRSAESEEVAVEKDLASGPSAPVRLARQALRHYLEHGRPLEPPDPLPAELSSQAGAFVSLKKGEALRGCIGTVEPTRKNLAEEIIMNAISAGVRDPRFNPVRLEEIDDLAVSVDVLMPLERIDSLAELDPKKYGVLVRSGHRSGLLLPDLEGIDTAPEQVAIARQKAGIGPREPVELYRFEVRRYE